MLKIGDSYAGSINSHRAVMRSTILRMIKERGEISRSEVAALINVSKVTAYEMINDLISEGLVIKVGTGPSSGGRRPVMLKFNADAGHIITIDLGATSLDVGVVNLHPEIYAKRSITIDVSRPPTEVLPVIFDLVRTVIADLGHRDLNIVGIGMGVPGPVEFKTGYLTRPPLMPDWHFFPLKEILSKEFGCPAFVDNDVNIMALGEFWRRNSVIAKNMIYIKVGTGIGAGIICRGELYRGVTGSAGDVGHICIDYNGPLCRCGNRGCLEAMAAAPAMVSRAVNAAKNAPESSYLRRLYEAKSMLTCEDIGQAAMRGDGDAITIIKDSGYLIGRMLASIVNFFNPSIIIIGGGVSNIGDMFLSSIREAVYSRSLPLSTKDLRIETAVLKEDAGLIGAALMVMEQLFPIHSTYNDHVV